MLTIPTNPTKPSQQKLNPKWRRLLITIITIALIISPVSASSPNTTDTTASPIPITIQGQEQSQLAPDLQILQQIIELLEQQHITTPEREELIRGAIDGMIEALDDPYTDYFTPQEYNEFMSGLDMNLEGVGMFLERKAEQIIVVRPIPGTPAFEAGILAEDRIISVDGTATSGLTLEQVVAMIRGPRGTTVTLELERARDRSNYTVTLTRQHITVPTVHAEWHDGIIHAEILTFGESTARDFRAVLTELPAEHGQALQGIIIDVRNNSGGRLQSVIDLVDSLLAFKPVLIYQERTGASRTYSTGALANNTPAVVLVNHLSASAAEILAGALQDNERAPLIGRQTFGKGSVQQLIPLNSGGFIKITTAEYLTPDGNPVNLVGIKPDYQFHYPSTQLAQAFQLLRPSTTRTVQFQLDSDIIEVQGNTGQVDVAPTTHKGHVYLPLRFMLEALGAQVDWNNGTQSITYKLDNKIFFMSTIRLDQPLMTIDGRTMISLDDFSRMLALDREQLTADSWILQLNY